MKPLILILLCLPALALAQEFQFRQEYDTILVEIDGWRPYQPWVGGLSHSIPDFCDLDADNDLDLVVGSNYPILFFLNIGNPTNPIFTSALNNIPNLSTIGNSAPKFCDIDNDGDYDLFATSDERLWYWKNVGTANQPQFQFITDSVTQISTWISYPALIDIDGDGDFDLFSDYAGAIQFYRNIGTPNLFNFSFVTTTFSGIDVGSHATPTFIDIDADGDYDLFIGNEAGNIYFYRNDGTAQQYNFTLVTNNYNNIDVGEYASPEFADIDGDGDYDLLVGRECPGLTNSPGDIFYYKNVGTPQVAQWQFITANFLSIDVGYDAQGTTTDIDADRDFDIFIRNSGSYLSYYQNIGAPDSAAFSWVTDAYQDIHGSLLAPFFSDINGDNAPDLFMGEVVVPNPPYPNLYLYLNQGTPQNASFTSYSSIAPNNYHVGIFPSMADIDSDGDKDLFISDNNGYFYYYENIGTPTHFQFSYQSNNWQGITLPAGCSSYFYDIDNDNDLDLFFAVPWGTYNLLWFYRNTGTQTIPNMVRETQYFLGNQGLNAYHSLDVIDIDNDGYGDFLLSTGSGGMVFYRNITGDSTAVLQPTKMRPRPSRATLTIGPNPSNPISLISFSLPAPQEVSLEVYNILGSKIATLVSGKQSAGDHTVSWNATGNASGVYLVRLTTPHEEVTKKIVVTK
ncbi:MAG: FG-GAP-like repeat-containing protein [bacterium]|nr:FG-GAP-like repeat-containing protein [bacterium]